MNEGKSMKKRLLEHYASREPKVFYQYDGFVVGKNFDDDIMRPDKDGDSLWRSNTRELMYGADVRVLIIPSLSKGDVLRLLHKIIAWLERDDLPSVEFLSPEDWEDFESFMKGGKSQ